MAVRLLSVLKRPQMVDAIAHELSSQPLEVSARLCDVHELPRQTRGARKSVEISSFFEGGRLEGAHQLRQCRCFKLSQEALEGTMPGPASRVDYWPPLQGMFSHAGLHA